METTRKYEWGYAIVLISPCSKNDHINIDSKLLLSDGNNSILPGV